jgi:hypothetical protein
MLPLFIGLMFLLLFVEFITSPTIFKCDRLRNKCVRLHKHFWQSDYKEEKLCDVHDIKDVRVACHEESNSTMYSVVLELNNGDSLTIFNSSSSSRSEHEKQAQLIKDFLQYKTSEVVIKDLSMLLLFVFALFCVALLIVGLTELGLLSYIFRLV